jgi:hypothetical protein
VRSTFRKALIGACIAFPAVCLTLCFRPTKRIVSEWDYDLKGGVDGEGTFSCRLGDDSYRYLRELRRPFDASAEVALSGADHSIVVLFGNNGHHSVMYRLLPRPGGSALRSSPAEWECSYDEKGTLGGSWVTIHRDEEQLSGGVHERRYKFSGGNLMVSEPRYDSRGESDNQDEKEFVERLTLVSRRVFPVLQRFRWTLGVYDVLGKEYVEEWHRKRFREHVSERNTRRCEEIYNTCSGALRKALNEAIQATGQESVSSLIESGRNRGTHESGSRLNVR